jgi:hypothetical protein
MKHSKQFALSIKDIIKGFITSFLTVVITMLITVLNTGIFPATLEQWKPILLAGLTACLAYLLKNWLTNSDNKFLIKENESI